MMSSPTMPPGFSYASTSGGGGGDDDEDMGVPVDPATLQPKKPPPRSCDTFAVLGDATADGSVLFGKNSDRPHDEVQEVIAVAAATHAAGATLKCTYIEIPQVAATHACVLSRPSWLWGAEMGANSHGLCVGNEAVGTVEPDSEGEALLGMDLVRLALERATTAREGVEVITALLEAHGQGGGCAEGDDWTYHNGFLLADRTEAWVLETAGEWWAAEVITTGARHISNGLSIRGDPSARGGLVRPGLLDHARARGYWRGDAAFDWASCFGSGGVCAELPKSQREAAGARLLAAKVGSFAPPHMMEILRDEKSGICMTGGVPVDGVAGEPAAEGGAVPPLADRDGRPERGGLQAGGYGGRRRLRLCGGDARGPQPERHQPVDAALRRARRRDKTLENATRRI